MEPFMQIEDMAQHTGLSAHTLRYYERIGLIAPVQRAPGGQRRYGPADLTWIQFLLRLRNTGMPIRQMQVYAQMRSAGDTTLIARRDLLQAHLQAVEAQLQELAQTAGYLREKIAIYDDQVSRNPSFCEDTPHDARHPEPPATTANHR
ncbi:MerR family transcriptional regulator [Silvimonas iriomotensis]|uniref:HTH merR-type domain-containing protein n=1 Tax=Silvimonas iriomotensis TaxID=449662 RepID=A0ABQ2P7W2_9NEIS|nr:MerR family transcriptional regulator [Silvimonas iriomotensis]GGP20547.1 hypothetical protein GCM10010970_15750 [Silvimonas iriomotensis]